MLPKENYIASKFFKNCNLDKMFLKAMNYAEVF